MTQVSLTNLHKTYPGEKRPALDALNLQIDSGRLTAILGPSGCGKTTTLKLIAGVLEPTTGDITFDGCSVTRIKPEKRGAVMVYQNYLLFPFLSVAENVGFGLKMRKLPSTQIKPRVDEMLALVQLDDLHSRKPSELSGGQQQRVALARALVVQPQVLLLDEPLSSLDTHLREEMRELICSLQKQLGLTTIFVTHDQEEAIVMADHIALLDNGQLIQHDRPEAFFSQPVNEASARFFGGQNFISGAVKNGIFNGQIGQLAVPSNTPEGPGRLTFRPECIRMAQVENQTNTLTARVVEKVFMGTQTRLHLDINEQTIVMIAHPSDVDCVREDELLCVHIPPGGIWLIPE
ncbi:MAG: ABC transporter ATP-binding protein [Granulosicoccus sp.]